MLNQNPPTAAADNVDLVVPADMANHLVRMGFEDSLGHRTWKYGILAFVIEHSVRPRTFGRLAQRIVEHRQPVEVVHTALGLVLQADIQSGEVAGHPWAGASCRAVRMVLGQTVEDLVPDHSEQRPDEHAPLPACAGCLLPSS